MGYTQFNNVIILVDCLIPIQLSNCQKVTWLVLPAAWRLKLSTVILATVARKPLPSGFNLPQADSQWIGEINMIPKSRPVVLLPIIHFFTSFVKYLPHI
jgi:hypothetical protein